MYICELVFLTCFLEQCFISPCIFIFIIWKSAWRRELCTNSCQLSLLIKSMLHGEASYKNGHVTDSSLRHQATGCISVFPYRYTVLSFSVSVRGTLSLSSLWRLRRAVGFITQQSIKSSHFFHSLLGLCLRNEFESTTKTKLKGFQATVHQSSEFFILVQ